MFSYSGPARMTYPDGNAVELDRVDLIETVNDGFWQLSGAGTATAELTGGEARIKLPTGGAADVMVSKVRVSEGVNGVTSTVTLLGT